MRGGEGPYWPWSSTMIPPGRRSISTGLPCPNQVPTCSGSVSTAQTRSTGAAMLISRSIRSAVMARLLVSMARCASAALHIETRCASDDLRKLSRSWCARVSDKGPRIAVAGDAGGSLVVGADDEVVEGSPSRLIADLLDRPTDVVQLSDRHLQRSFVWLVGREHGVVDARLPSHLDVTAEYVGNGPPGSEGD